MTKSAPDRALLLTLLSQWRDGVIDEARVQESAEALIEASEYIEDIPHDDDRSVAVEVLSFLETLPALLITTQDIDAFVEFLSTPAGHAEEGWRNWLAYWDSVDESERRNSLRGHPFYFA